MSTGFLSTLWAGLTSEDAASASQQQSSYESETGERSNDSDKSNEVVESLSDTPKANIQDSSLFIPALSLTEDKSLHGRNDSPQGVPLHEKDQVAATILSPSPDERTGRIVRPEAPLQGSSMLPPALPTLAPQQKVVPPMQTSLRIPPSGPLPNRGPPTSSQQRAGSSNTRGKVLLAPGHSPMDWAALTRSANLSGVPSLQRVTLSQMRLMNGRKGKPVWSSWQGKVYNITPYLPYHPGGEKELFKAAGRDATQLFLDVHPWVNWENMLSSCLVGILVSDSEQESSLDAID